MQVELQQKLSKNRILSLNNISPLLASLSSPNLIPAPILQSSNTEKLFISSFDTNVYALPTKTKPKKISFLASNGKHYSFLLKGFEDLHLDERVCQFISIVDGLLKAKNPTSTSLAKSYHVVPLGNRHGLIEWVPNMLQLFSLYKKHLNSKNFGDMSKPYLDEPELEKVKPTRPLDLFYKKIDPLLKKKNISRTHHSRASWPVEVVKNVYNELVSETPSDLISRELYCSSESPSSWFSKQKHFAKSISVMSMVGYILGLGDRHLDNILLDLTTGTVLHIDYNVCFDKGKKLRVPEMVPFRLSPNFVNAFGITKEFGIFRETAIETLQLMNKNRDILMTLLESFVWDPLEEWSEELAHGHSNLVSDLTTNLNFLSTRASKKFILFRSNLINR